MQSPLNLLIDTFAERVPAVATVSETAALLGLSVEALLDQVSRVVAERYVGGGYEFGFADLVMNHLFAYVHQAEDVGFSLSDFAWNVYLAFDEGEFIRQGAPEDAQGEALTRRLLADVLQRFPFRSA